MLTAKPEMKNRWMEEQKSSGNGRDLVDESSGISRASRAPWSCCLDFRPFVSNDKWTNGKVELKGLLNILEHRCVLYTRERNGDRQGR